MPSSCDSASACSGQACTLKAQPRKTFAANPKTSLEQRIREVASLACPRFEERLGKKACRLEVVVLRVSLLGQEPVSWLSSLGDWAISKQEALQVEVTSSHDSSRTERVTSHGADGQGNLTHQVQEAHEPKHTWVWRSGGAVTMDAFSNTELSIAVSQSISSSFKPATPWSEVGALKLRLDQDVFCHLCTFVPGQSACAFEAPWISFPLTHDARPTGSIELLFRLLPGASFDKSLLLDGVRSSGAPLRHLIGHSDAVLGCKVFDCGTRIVTISGDRRGIIWDALSGSKLKELVGHSDWVQDCAVFPDGGRILTVSFDKKGIIWDAQSGAKLRELVGHADWVKGCDVFPDGDRVLTVSFDKTGIIWDTSSGVQRTHLKGHTDWVNACAVFPDGGRVLTVSTDRKGIIWSSRSGQKLRELVGHTDSIEGCAVFPDGVRAMTGARDTTGIIWDTRTGQSLQVLVGHSDWVQGCAVFPQSGANDDPNVSDGDSALWEGQVSTKQSFANQPYEGVITVSSDNTAIIWDACSGAKLQTLVGHTNLIHACAVFPSGGKVVTASGDERCIIWDARTALNLRNM